jgi:hypothetical protein
MRSGRLSYLLIPAACLAGAALAASQAPAPAAAPPAAASPPVSTVPTAAPASSAPAIQLSPVLPADVGFGGTVSLPALQQDFDIFSWNSFIAASWPPAPGGNADPARKPGASKTGDNRTVWEGWRSVSNIFLPDGKTPTWSGHQEIPAICKAKYKPGMKLLQQIGKTPGLLSETVQPFETGPLVDQNHAYTRFEIVVNRNMFDYILANSLYSAAGQKAFTGPVKFPCGTGNQLGAIMVKAAWKVLGPGDDPRRFHTSRALVYTPPSVNPPVTESCSTQTAGLVGLHIAHKVNSAPQWVWSTFEQVDNDPAEADVKSGMLRSHYSYYNPKCPTCAVNQAPPRPWIPNQKATPVSQVMRADVLPPFATQSAQARNADGLKLLRGVSARSVWQYYHLVSTQWPTDPGPGNCNATATDPLGNPAPQFLANTTLETYVQGTTPNVSSSCMECHGNAAMTTGGASDFTYILQRAK